MTSPLLPAEPTPSAITAALARLADQRHQGELRLASLRHDRAQALLDPDADIATMETAITETTVAIERLDALRPVLETKLEEAREAAEQRELQQVIDQAAQAIAALRIAERDYPEAAQRIAAVCRLAAEAQAAIFAASQHGVSGFDPPWAIRLSHVVVLPSTDGGFVWSPPVPPVSPYRV